MDRGSYNGRGGGNRGRDRGRVRGYNEPRQGRARGYNEPRQDRARAYYELEQVRARGQHEQEQGRGRGGRDGFQMSSSSSNQSRPSGQHQFTETGAPENQPVSQTPEATVISWADRLRRGVGTASPRPQQQQGRGVTSTVWARPQLQQGRGGGVGQQHGGGNQQQEGVDRPPLRSSDASVLLGKINLKDSKKREPMGRPDGGNNSYKSISLHANHFPVKFKDGTIILHYDVDVQQVDENQPGKPVTEMFDLRKIREKWLMDKPAEFPCDKTAYDGNKNIFSAVDLPAKPLTVNCSVGDDAKECKYTLTFKLVAQLQLDNVTGYVKRNLQNIPRDVLQGMDLVMKENPRRCRISVGRCFYSNNAYKNLNCGVVARKGFQQSLKLTSEGLALCLDYSELLVIPEKISVIGFLKIYYGGKIEDIFKYRRAAASDLLAGLKVKVTHRPNKQKFVIKKLVPGETRSLTFRLQDTKQEVYLVDYFNEKYTRKIQYKHLPSLDIGKGDKENYVPVEFCELVAGQRFPKDRLKTASPKPEERRKLICETVLATDGPRTTIPGNFKIRVDDHMTCISGRILPVPVLKLGGQIPPYLNDKTCQWNLVGKSVVEGKALQRWALIDFSSKESRDLLKLQVDKFVLNLRDRCRELSINMEEPAVVHSTDMKELSAVSKVENLLKAVVDAADQKIKGKLQMIVCVMTSKHNGYKYLKWVSETKIGIVTQCCLSSNANKLHNQYLANLCMKINAKLGGSNMELMERLPSFASDDNVMFIGADVNHPAAGNVKCPSIAAVVATIVDRDITRNFEIGVDRNMTRVPGRILPPPDLKLGGQSRLPVNDKCQWNLVGKSVVEGKALQRWALIDFSSQDRKPFFRLRVDEFVFRLKDRCRKLSINMEEPAVVHFTDMNELSAVGKVETLLKGVVDAADQKIKGKLQMIVCVMTSKHNGYKYLKWVSETKIGVVTQCCLSPNANKGQDQYLANLCMKINAKLGGSNMELMDRLPNFGREDNVMFIGADVNHPAAKNVTCPSIAAVVATVNWPAANRYAARVCPQVHRTEKILNFGSMCADLVNTYARFNSVKPNKIVVFRDGVSESQFDMVLNEELNDLVEAIYESNKYQPAITLVVAQKRHHTRLFPMDGNVSPGTVVDTQIVHPSGFDFYLCSHYGQLGTSKATHYHVLYDENGFKSVDLQRLIYNMCFTFARCTKPVSLVPPVYYADLVAYRGRMFQEVLKEMNSSRSTTSSSEASSSSSSPIDSFAQGFYDLHRDLQNIMFFV